MTLEDKEGLLRCFACPSGRVSGAGESACEICLPGTVSNAARSKCDACVTGRYSDTSGRAVEQVFARDLQLYDGMSFDSDSGHAVWSGPPPGVNVNYRRMETQACPLCSHDVALASANFTCSSAASSVTLQLRARVQPFTTTFAGAIDEFYVTWDGGDVYYPTGGDCGVIPPLGYLRTFKEFTCRRKFSASTAGQIHTAFVHLHGRHGPSLLVPSPAVPSPGPGYRGIHTGVASLQYIFVVFS